MKIFIFIALGFFIYSCFPSPTNYNGKYPPKVAAEKNLDMAKKAIEKDYYEEAYNYLEYVQTHYPYELEAQERVKIMYGDILFKQGKYIDAIETYRSFIKLHPNSKYVSYAQFKIAQAYYNDIPSDFILFPPPYERDKESIIYAKKALMFYIGNYPKAPNIKKAKKMLKKTIDYLAHYQYYVGKFYYDREKYAGATRRFEKLLLNYPNSSYTEDATYKLIVSYIKLKNKEKAENYIKLYLTKYKKSSKIKELENKIKKISKK